MQSGVGPFLAIFLIASRHWNAADIGMVMTTAGTATLVAQTPAGAFIDGTHRKRGSIIAAAAPISVAALAAIAAALPVLLFFMPETMPKDEQRPGNAGNSRKLAAFGTT